MILGAQLRLPAGELPDVVFLEGMGGGSYPDRPADVLRYRRIIDTLGTRALLPEQTPEILARILRDL